MTVNPWMITHRYHYCVKDITVRLFYKTRKAMDDEKIDYHVIIYNRIIMDGDNIITVDLYFKTKEDMVQTKLEFF